MPNPTKWRDAVRIPLLARERAGEATGAAAAHLNVRPDQPQVALGLDTNRQLSEGVIAEWLGSEDPRVRRRALNALSDRMQLYGDLLTGQRTVQLSNAALFPDLQNAGLPVAVMLGDADRQMVDLRWTALFDIQDRRSEPFPGFFKMVNLYHAVTVDQVLPGERLKLGFVEQDETILEHYLYYTGLQWNQLLMEGRWDRQRGMSAMLTKWANYQAQAAYTTLTTSGYATTSYVDDDASGNVTLQNDIATINAAILAIRTALYQATAPKGAQQLEEEFASTSAFYLLYNDLTAGYEDRVNAALEVRYQVVQGSGTVGIKEVNRPIIPVGSPRVPTGNFFLVMPGRKNVFSINRDLRFRDFQDVRVAGVAEGEVGVGAWRALRGDVNQVQAMALS